MQLSKFSDYGLRVLIHLATHQPERQSVRQIAGAYNISEHHVAKIASELVRGGFVVSGRGRVGGLQLADDAREISIGKVLRHLNKDAAVVECFAKTGCECAIEPQCGLKAPLARAREAFFASLDDVTLSDATPDIEAMLQLLSVEA